MGFLEFALKALELKDIERTGWIVRSVESPESIADHSFFLALLCLLYADKEKLNAKKCVSLALVHDLHESICGDICSREFEHEQEMSNAEKKRVEENAILEFLELVPAEQRKKTKSLAIEFLGQSSKEAIFVRDMDLLEMCLQALYYKKKNRAPADLSDFFRKTKRELKTRTGKKLFAEAEKEFEKLKK